jgi:crossover junction endodeoxyribonuclease RuvC
MRVLGIDTSLRCTGLGVVEREGVHWRAVDFGLIRNAASLPRSSCLHRIHMGVADFIGRTKPDEVALEAGFFARNARTAMILGEARGVVIAAASAAGLPTYEHSPRRVKQAVVGFGGAQKIQVARMIMRLLGLLQEPPEDAADALAIAICHLQGQGPMRGHQAKAI